MTACVSGVPRNFSWEGLRLPSPSLSTCVPLLSFPFPLPVFPFLCPPLPLKLGPSKIQRSLGERSELPREVWGEPYSRNRSCCILALKDEIWWQQFWLICRE